jgi:AcrR family transcriptional regulator
MEEKRRPLLPARVRKKKGEGAQRRREILEVAKRLFVEEGYDATTIRRIATQVGISSTALYVYFEDKDAILKEISNETFAGLIEELDGARRDYPDPATALKHVLEGYIRFGLAHASEYELTFMTRDSKEVHHHAGTEIDLGFQAFSRFHGFVDAIVRSGRTHESNTDRLTYELWAGIHGLVALLLSKPVHDWGEVDKLIAGHVALLMRGACSVANLKDL